MNLNNLSDIQLHQSTKSTTEKERQTTVELLWHLRENEKRMLFAQMGCRDLKEYCVKELKLSEGSAWRRISAMRLLQEIPEIESKIQSGDLNLTQIAMARTHFRELKSSKLEKQNILVSLENQSSRKTERILAENKPEEFAYKPEVIEKPLRGQKLEITLVLDQELQQQLEEIQILLGKPHSKLDLLRIMTKEKLHTLKKDKVKASKTKGQNLKPVGRIAQPALLQPTNFMGRKVKNTRYIPRNVLREVKSRDQHQCQFIHPSTSQQCEARFHLQVEHVFPFAKGGNSSTTNLQMLCSNHNRLRSIQHFGAQKMKAFLPSIK